MLQRSLKDIQIINPSAGREPTLLPCPICQSRNFQDKYGPIKRCRNCGLGMVNPLGEFRGEHETQEYFLNDYLPLMIANREATMAERRAHISTICRHFQLPYHPRHLDVGCALGFMLQEAKAIGWESTGLETSQFAARYAEDNSQCRVHTGTLEEVAFDSESFDVITLMDVIEHVPHPEGLLREIYRVLRPAGVLYIVTPNFSSFFVHLFGLKAYGIWPDQHVVYFNSSSMHRLLVQVGFKTIVIGTKDFYYPNLQRLLGSRERRPLPKMKAAFSQKPLLKRLRSATNSLFAHVPLGDKLIVCAQK